MNYENILCYSLDSYDFFNLVEGEKMKKKYKLKTKLFRNRLCYQLYLINRNINKNKKISIYIYGFLIVFCLVILFILSL